MNRLQAPRPRSIRVLPGWRSGLAAVVAASVTAALIITWTVSIEWIAVRGALGGLLLLTVGLLVGSRHLVGLAALPALAGTVIGFDRLAGHAWGQTLLVGVLWYLASELAWASIEARDEVDRSRAVDRQRIAEVASVVVVTIIVAAAGLGLSTLAPIRTALVKGVAVALVVAALGVLGRRLSQH